LSWCRDGHGLFHDLGLITVSNNDGGVAVGFGFAIEPSSATHRLRRYSLRSCTTGSKIKVT
jgi:hypothetical protein